MSCWKRARIGVLLSGLGVLVCLPLVAQQPDGSGEPAAGPTLTLKATVRRVLVDVVVTDKHGAPVPGLTQEDFTVLEDDKPQRVLSFDAHGFTGEMDYLPPKMPAQPPNTFVNLPATPEKGPLYVLLYDLVNVDHEHPEYQMFARKQLVKFIREKPEGTRFAIFVLSDGLHLAQGFTADKEKLFVAIDPAHSRSHMPQVFLMGPNFGQNDAGTSLWVLKYLANYLDGLPGRKNILWLSGGFPLALFPSDEESLAFRDEAKKILAIFARDQIAIYPVDVRGVSVENPHAPSGATGGGGIQSDAREISSPSATNPVAGSQGASAGGIGYNMLSSSYAAEEEIARITGGRAFYSTNDVTMALKLATEDGESYYTLSYDPGGSEYDRKLHGIKVKMEQKGFQLAYRQAYYALDPELADKSAVKPRGAGWTEAPAPRPVGDSLDANMQYGAPIAHGVVFGAHVEAVGVPGMGTAAEMAQLADQPAFFKARRTSRPAKLLAPMPLQRYRIDYTVMAHQLHLGGEGAMPRLEVAVAAYDGEGMRLSAAVHLATSETGVGQQKSYRVEQELLTPAGATSLRLAVRDANTDRIGAMEVKLPLAPETRAAVGDGAR